MAVIGIVAVGTLFSAMAINTRLAELLRPRLSFPFFVPILLTRLRHQRVRDALSAREMAR